MYMAYDHDLNSHTFNFIIQKKIIYKTANEKETNENK